jgi:hypothetical protein
MQGSVGKKKVFADIILICILLVLALSVFLVVELTRREGAYVVVSIDGGEVCRYSLSEDGEFLLNGGTNTLVISGGKAYISEADCPDGLCVSQGKISRTGQTVVCLPNRVMLRIVGAEEADVELEVQ